MLMLLAGLEGYSTVSCCMLMVCLHRELQIHTSLSKEAGNRSLFTVTGLMPCRMALKASELRH